MTPWGLEEQGLVVAMAWEVSPEAGAGLEKVKEVARVLGVDPLQTENATSPKEETAEKESILRQ